MRERETGRPTFNSVQLGHGGRAKRRKMSSIFRSTCFSFDGTRSKYAISIFRTRADPRNFYFLRLKCNLTIFPTFSEFHLNIR